MLAGLPRSVPGYAIDRMCAGAMTAVTNTAAAIGFGAHDVALAGGVEHMGHHPMGFDADPNPRFLSERLVDQRRARTWASTAENLHDTFPRPDARARRRVRRRQPGQVRRGAAAGKIDPDLVPVALRDPENGWGLATADEPPRPGTTVEAIQKLPTPFRAGGRVTAGTAAPPDRRRERPACSPPRRPPPSWACRRACGWSSFAYAGVEPEIMGIGPVPATDKALERPA